MHNGENTETVTVESLLHKENLRVIGGTLEPGLWGEGYEVLISGMNGLPRNTRCNASSVLTLFLRAVET